MSEKRYPRTILATACIPWTESYELDEKCFRDEVRGLIGRGIHNIYVFGTAGEGYAVSDEQFETVVRVFADEMKGPDLYPMVGLISLSLSTMIKRVRLACSYGIRDFQFALPSWGALSDKELLTFAHLLCDPFPDCRFLNYNQSRAKRILGVSDYVKLAEEIPNLVGAKFADPTIATMIDIVDSDCPLQFFVCEYAYGYGCMIGEFAYLLSIAYPNITRAWEYFHAGVAKDREKLLQIQQECRVLNKGLMDIVGTTFMDGAYDKMFSRLLDDEFPLRLLPPYSFVSEDTFTEYRRFIEDSLPQWAESNNP